MDFNEAKKFLDKTNCVRIGKILKTHGYKGQIAVVNYIAFEQLGDFVLAEYQGFLLPLFIDKQNSVFHTKPIIVKFKRINNIDEAKKFLGADLFYPVELLSEQDFEVEDFTFVENFLMIDVKKGEIGKILHFENFKNNPVFEVNFKGKEILVPLNGLEPLSIDLEERIFEVELHESLYNLFNS